PCAYSRSPAASASAWGLRETDLGSLIMVPGEVTEDRSGRGRHIVCRVRDDTVHNPGLGTRLTSTTGPRKPCTTRVRICCCRRCRRTQPERQRQRHEYDKQ